MKQTILVTGGTGLVGGNLIPRLLSGDPERQVIALVRGKNQQAARQRLHDHLRRLTPASEGLPEDRLEVLCGDVTGPRLGLSTADYDRLSSALTHIIHSAATVEFTTTLDAARRVNVGGTQNVLELASRAMQHGTFQRMAYISTAYVSGNRKGVVHEVPTETPGAFSNAYEQSKFEAETLVRSFVNEIPLTVFRPSIIVGDSRTGRTSAFNVLYQPLRMIFRGIVGMIPGSRQTRMDIVPVDFVCDALCRLFFSDHADSGSTYHLTAGASSATPAGEIVDLAVQYFNERAGAPRVPKVKFIPSILCNKLGPMLSKKHRRAIRSFRAYASYLSVDRVYDNSRTMKGLAGSGISLPSYRSYYRNLLDFCLEANWGKRAALAA